MRPHEGEGKSVSSLDEESDQTRSAAARMSTRTYTVAAHGGKVCRFYIFLSTRPHLFGSPRRIAPPVSASPSPV